MDESTTTSKQHHWTWRYRYKLAPLYAVLATLALGFASYALSASQAILTTLVVSGGLLVLAQARWGRKKGKDKAMLAFVWSVVLAFSAFIVTIRFGLLPGAWTFVVIIVCSMVLGLFWWLDRRNARVIEIEDELRRWPLLAKQIGIPKVKKMPKRITETGEEHMLWWDKGATTLEAVRGQARAIEQALGIPFKKIRFEHVVDNKGLIDSSRWRVTANTESPILDAPVPFTEPTMRSIYDPMLVGQLENGENYYVTWYEKSWGGRHTLAGGQTGCIAAESRIYLPDSDEHVRVDELARRGEAITVLSWTPDGLVRARTDGAPFVKGVEQLYEVQCSDGATIRVTSEHRFLTPRGWRRLADVREGQLVASAPLARPATPACDPSQSPADVLRCSGTAAGCSGRCSTCRGLDDRRPLPTSAVDRAAAPSPTGAPARTPGGSPRDGVACAPARSRAYRPGSRLARIGCVLELLLGFVRRVRGAWLPSTRPCAWFRAPAPDLRTSSPSRAVLAEGPRRSPFWQLGSWSSASPGQNGETNLGLRMLASGSGAPTRRTLGTGLLGSLQLSSADTALPEGWATGLSGDRLSAEALPARRGAASPASSLSLLDRRPPASSGPARTSSSSPWGPRNNVSGWNRIRTIRPAGVETYYDLTVPGPANYVAEGIVHHNSGKSGLFDLVFAESLYCRNLVKWGMDRKGGMAYLPWAPTFDWIATDEQGCIAMLSAVKEVLEYRAKIAGERNWKVWRATAKEPLLLVNIDEAAEVLGSWGPATELVASITRRGRAAGVLLYLAVQHLTAEAISSSQITKNIGRRFCFSCSDHGMQYYILPNSKETVDACSIPLGPAHAGTFYVSDGNVLNPLSGRVRYVDEAKVRELVVGLGDRTPVLDLASREAAQRGSAEFAKGAEELTYDGRKHYLVEDLPPLEDDESDTDDGWDPNEDTEDDTEGTEKAPESATEDLGAPWTDDRTEEHPGVRMDKTPTTQQSDMPTMERETPMVATDLLSTKAALSEMTFEEMSALLDPEVLKAAQIAFQVEQAHDTNVTDVEALDRLTKALDATGQKPIQVKDLLPIVGREKTWMHARLADMAAKGEVEKVSRGLYRRPDGWKPVLELIHAQ